MIVINLKVLSVFMRGATSNFNFEASTIIRCYQLDWGKDCFRIRVADCRGVNSVAEVIIIGLMKSFWVFELNY